MNAHQAVCHMADGYRMALGPPEAARSERALPHGGAVGGAPHAPPLARGRPYLPEGRSGEGGRGATPTTTCGRSERSRPPDGRTRAHRGGDHVRAYSDAVNAPTTSADNGKFV